MEAKLPRLPLRERLLEALCLGRHRSYYISQQPSQHHGNGKKDERLMGSITRLSRVRSPSLPGSLCRLRDEQTEGGGSENDSDLLFFSFISSSSCPLLSSSSSDSERTSLNVPVYSCKRKRTRTLCGRHGLSSLTMGNQDAKPKRSAQTGEAESAADDCSHADATKKGFHGKKCNGKHGKHTDGGGKKKAKSESKSVFSNIRKRKKVKGLLTGSREDALDSQPDELDTKTPELSADELGQSDIEDHRPILSGSSSRMPEALDKKTSSGSDTDIYSFHSAAEHEDLLADIQHAIRLQHQWQPNGFEAEYKQKQLRVNKDEPFTMLDVPQQQENSQDRHFKAGDDPVGETSNREEEESANERNKENRERVSVNGKLDIWDPGFCAAVAVATSTKESEPVCDITPSATKTTSVVSFQDCTSSFESAIEATEEVQDEIDQEDSSPDTKLPETGASSLPLDPELTVVEILVAQALSESKDEEDEKPEVPRRRSSISLPQWLQQESPVTTRHSKPSVSSSPTVKPYPPIHPSYIKTTTRQLSSPAHSPAQSPNHSPHCPRRTRHTPSSTTITTVHSGRKQHGKRQRSFSVTGPISRSADWTEELRKLPTKTSAEDFLEYGGSEGSLRTGGEATRTAYRRASAGQVSTSSFQDVFTGNINKWLIIHCFL